jgi:putative hydrolase of the HAD superfamily
MSVDGVLFDVDDTLVDTRGAFAHAFEAVGERYLPHLPASRRHELVAAWRADPLHRFAAYTRGEVGYEEQRLARAQDLHGAFGGPTLDDETFPEWNSVFESAFSAAWAALPDASGVVDELLATGVVVGALTNAAVAYQTRKLERAGLGSRVPLLVGVDTLGVGKPDPRVFLEACRRLGTDPARTAYVGDELDVDAVAAREAGLVGVWVDRPGARRRPVSDVDVAAAGVLVVTSLTGLTGALERRSALRPT